MEDGQEVIIGGNISVYERDGKYQLYAKQIELAGDGQLYEKFEALKKKLEAQGLFDDSWKKKIPVHATKVGVVTASTGAAIQDIRNIAKRRNPYVPVSYTHLCRSRRLFSDFLSGNFTDGVYYKNNV